MREDDQGARTGAQDAGPEVADLIAIVGGEVAAVARRESSAVWGD